MPAEAIHFTALEDTMLALPISVRKRMACPEMIAATRLGTMFVDLPYFESIGMSLVCHALAINRRPHPQPWGDWFHQRAPIEVGIRIGEQGVKLARHSDTRNAGERLIAMSLGYMCHAAIDAALHPMVNELAVERAERFGDHPLRQHREIEKYQSVLFHEERHHWDYLGTPMLKVLIALDPSPLWNPGPLCDGVQHALTDSLGEAPSPYSFRRWGSGYERYVALIAGPIGRWAISKADKEREQPALYTTPAFPERYSQALSQSIKWVRLLADHLSHGEESSRSRAALLREIPEQSIDPPFERSEHR